MFRLITTRMGSLHADTMWNNRVHASKRRARRLRGGAQHPVGPKLIVGRGLARRRAPITWYRWLVYALLAGAILLAVTAP